MKEEHPSFPRPDNLDSKVWRYIDFAKYVSLLSTSSLFFVRADKFEDKFEGAATKVDIDELKKILEEAGVDDSSSDFISLYNKNERKLFGVCSWHLSEYESAAMWKIFLKSNDGVVIQSTFRKLANSFDAYDKETIYTGLVEYTDYDTDTIPFENNFNRFMHKRKSFGFEKEVRSVFCRYPQSNDKDLAIGLTGEKNDEYFETIKGNGEYVSVDLNNLIENIIISPYANDWFFNMVTDVTKKYDFNFPVGKSKLAEVPYF